MSNIIASLKYGRIWKKKGLCFLVACICLVFFLFVYSFIFGPNKDFLSFLGGILGGGIMIGVGGYFIIKNILLKTKIKKFLNDAVPLKAYAQLLKTGYSALHNQYVKITITFTYEKMEISRDSGVYDTVFYHFINKQVDILYSPKFDEILFLKSI